MKNICVWIMKKIVKNEEKIYKNLCVNNRCN